MADRNRFSSAVSTSYSAAFSSSSSQSASRNTTVLAVECIMGTSNADEWSGGLLQTGDIVEEIRIGELVLRSPFKNGRSGVHKILKNSFQNQKTSITVRVRRLDVSGGEPPASAELQACIVPIDIGGKKQYVLRGIGDPHYAVSFTDRTEADCLELQASRSTRIQQALEAAQVQDGYVSYPWQKRMQGLQQMTNSSSFLSILFLPKAADAEASSYNNIEDTLARANAWVNGAKTSGVPILVTNIQTESLLTKISGKKATCSMNISSLSELSNSSLYGFEDYHGIDIGVVRAIRLWYSPIGGEFKVTVDINEEDTKLGFAISRTEEGFIYISSVLEGDDNVPASRSGLCNLFNEATRASKLLVISRMNGHKILPWIVSHHGALRCFDTISLSQKLSLHRHAKVPMLMHIFLWDQRYQDGNPSSCSCSRSSIGGINSPKHSITEPPAEFHQFHQEDDCAPDPRRLEIERDTAGEASFRFHNFSLPTSWV